MTDWVWPWPLPGCAISGISRSLGVAALALACLSSSAIAAAPRHAPLHTLRAIVIDVEGGAATLIATPGGQSILLTRGWRQPAAGAVRVLAALQRLELRRLDVLIANYSPDLAAAVAALAQRVPIGEFWDAGLAAPAVPRQVRNPLAEYLRLSQGRRLRLHTGQSVGLRSAASRPPLSLTILAAAAQAEHRAGAPINPLCHSAPPLAAKTAATHTSLLVLLQFGEFRYLIGGDPDGSAEFSLVCPRDAIGPVSVYQVSQFDPRSAPNPVLIRTLRPTVTLVANIGLDGSSAATLQALRAEMPQRDLYQLHRSDPPAATSNEVPANVANPPGLDLGQGLRLEVATDGRSFRVINERTGQARAYSSLVAR